MTPELQVAIGFYAVMAVWSGRRFAWLMCHDESTGQYNSDDATMGAIIFGYALGMFWPVVWTLENIDRVARGEDGIAKRMLMSEPKSMKAKRLANPEDE